MARESVFKRRDGHGPEGNWRRARVRGRETRRNTRSLWLCSQTAWCREPARRSPFRRREEFHFFRHVWQRVPRSFFSGIHRGTESSERGGGPGGARQSALCRHVCVLPFAGV